MSRTTTAILLTLLMSALCGCSNRSRTVIGGADAQEAAIRLEESEQEYNDCVASRHVGAATCDSLKTLYEKDRAEYEAQVR